MASSLFRLLVLATIALAAGCGGSSSPASSAGGDPSPRLFEGRAVKGVVRHGLVEVHQYVEGGWQAVSGDVPLFTDADGLFDVDLSGTTGPVRITVTADSQTWVVCDSVDGCGEAAFGEDVAPPADFRLVTMIPSSRSGGQIAVTPLTHLAARWLEALPEGVAVTDALILLTHSRVADLFGLPDDFAWHLPVDITDADERSGAASLLHEFLGASFSGIANSYDADLQFVLELYASQFAGLAGQLSVQTDLEAMRPGLDIIHAIAIAAIELLMDEAEQEALLASVNHLIARWGENPITSAGGVTVFDQDEFNSALVLLDDLDHYLALAGIDENAGFLSAEMLQVRWLYADDTARQHTASMIRVVAENVIFAVIGSMSEMKLNALDEETRNAILEQNCIDLSDMPELSGLGLPVGYAVYCIEESRLSVSGVRHGQQVDVVIDIPMLSLDSPMAFSLSGAGDASFASVANATAVGALGGVMTVSLSGVNPDNLLDLQSLNVVVALDGAGQLTQVSTGDAFEVSLTASGQLNVAGVLSGEPVISLQIDDGDLLSPFGDRLWALHDEGFCKYRMPFELHIGENSSLDACFGFEAFGLPQMHMTVGGTMSGLFDFIGQIISGMGSFSGSFADLLDNLDPSVLALLGDARLKVLDEERGERVYVFALNNNRLDATYEETGESLSFYVTGLNGGYIFSGSTLVATVHSDWNKLGATLKFVDGREDRVYYLGQLSDVVDEDLVQLLLMSLFGVFESVSAVQL